VDYVRLYLDLSSPAVNERHEWNYELRGSAARRAAWRDRGQRQRHEWNYELCGDDVVTSSAADSRGHEPVKYYSSAPWLLIALHTDKLAANRTGFRAFYRFVDRRERQWRRQDLARGGAQNDIEITQVTHM